MSTHLQRDIGTLHNDLLSMYTIVEEMIQIAVDGLANPSSRIAETLRERDNEIDTWDVRIEDECLKVLALHQPVANELRRVASVLKITGELERVADLSVHIAERTSDTMYTDVTVPAALQRMANIAGGMLRQSISAYIELDADLARQGL
jgi:phosphate transport system protein